MTFLDPTLPARVSTQAQQVEFGRVLAVVLASLLYALGWLCARAVRGLWFGLTWTFAALRLGWREGYSSSRARSR